MIFVIFLHEPFKVHEDDGLLGGHFDDVLEEVAVETESVGPDEEHIVAAEEFDVVPSKHNIDQAALIDLIVFDGNLGELTGLIELP